MSPLLFFDDDTGGVVVAASRSADLPHFGAPFTWTTEGAVVVEQGTPTEIASCVFNIASCPVGFLAHDPGFGIDDLFGSPVPLDPAALVAEVGDQELRAAIVAAESGSSLDVSLRTISLQVSAQGGANA